VATVPTGFEAQAPDAPAAKATELSAAKVRELWQKGTRATEREIREYQIARSFLGNSHWVRWDKTRNTVTAMPRDPTRLQRTNNRLTPSTRTIMAKLLRRPLVFEVAPMASDDASVAGARVAAAVLHHAHREHDWERLRREAAQASWEGGVGLLALDWDGSAGAQVNTDPTDGRIGTGELVCSALAVNEATTVAGCRDIERARWWIRASALPPEDVQASYKMPNKPAADATAAGFALDASADTSDGRPEKALTTVLHYYERPFAGSKGQILVIVGDQVVQRSDWYFPFTDRLNVVAVSDISVKGRWNGDAILWSAIAQQTGLNLAETSIANHMRAASNARLTAPIGALDDPDDFTDTVGEVVEYTPIGGLGPEWLGPPQMPAWWQEEPIRLKADVDDILGLHDVSRGGAPAGVDSGVGLQLLAEQDDTPIGSMARDWAEGWARYGSMCLELYAVKVTETRKARISLPGQPPETREWTGKDFVGQTVASVPFDAVSPMSATAMWSRAMALWNAKIITDPKQFARMAEASDADMADNFDSNVARAQRENHEMSVGLVAIPRDFDDHHKHIAVHNEFRRSPHYEEMSAEDQHLVDQHVQAHDVLAAEEMAKQQLRAAVDPNFANAAQAHEPAPLGQVPPPPIDPAAMAPADAQTSPAGSDLAAPPPGALPPLA
jgi:hypothetical protein